MVAEQDNADTSERSDSASAAKSAGAGSPRVRSSRKGIPRVRPQTAVHVPRQRGGVKRAHAEAKASAVAEPLPQEHPTTTPDDTVDAPVQVREAKRPDPVPLPPPPELPSVEGLTFLDMQAPERETVDADEPEQRSRTSPVPMASRPVAAQDNDESDDASHTKMLLMLFLCTLVGGAGAIAYFISTQEVNPLEGLF